MSFLAAIVIMAWGGSVCQGVPCYFSDRACNPSMMPTDFPRNKEELEHGCRGLRTFGHCVLDVKERCGDPDNTISLLKRALPFLERVCNPSSAVYQSLSNNISCVYDALKTDHSACIVTPYRTKRIVMKTFVRKLLEEGYTHGSIEQCGNSLWIHACQAVTVGDRCGLAVKDVMLGLWRKVESLTSTCSEGILNHLPKLVQALEYETSKETVESAVWRKRSVRETKGPHADFFSFLYKVA